MSRRLLIGNGLAHLWAALIVDGTALAAVAFLTLDRHLTRVQDSLTELQPVAA